MIGAEAFFDIRKADVGLAFLQQFTGRQNQGRVVRLMAAPQSGLQAVPIVFQAVV